MESDEARAGPTVPFSPHTASVILWGLVLVLVGALAAGVYRDWVLEGESLWSPLAENTLPLALVVGVLVGGWVLSRRASDAAYLAEGAKWALLGFGTTVSFAGLVLSLQVLEGHLQFFVVLAHLAVLGTVGGLFVGIQVARERRARAALREREERFRGLCNSLPGVAFQFYARPDGTYGLHFVSDHAETVLGIPSDADAFFDQFVDRVPPSHREEYLQSVEEAVEAEGAWQAEIPYDHPSGEQRWLFGASVPQRRAGKLVFNGVLIDITDRKEAEQDLQRTTQLLEKTLESLNEAVLVVDPEEREIVTCNTAVQQVFGYEKDELIGERTSLLHVSPAAYERFAERSEPMLEEKGSFRGEYRMRRKDGRVIDTEHVVTPLESEKWPRGVVSVIRDITERKRHERLLRRKERRYQAVFEDPNILVALVDADGAVLNINQTAMNYVDASLEALRGRRFWETPWFAGDEAIQQQMRRWIGQAADGAYVGFEIDHTQALGVPLEVNGVVRPVTDEQGAVTSLLISAREVTERKQHERALVEAKERAEEASRLKSAMLANMSHEIRTPLTSISGFSELLSERLEGEAAQFNERIRRSSRRLMKTLNSVLELSRLEAGRDAFVCESLPLRRVAKETVELLRPQAEEKGVVLKTDLLEAAEGRWNESAVNRIAENLIENAVKFTPAEGQVEVRVRTEGADAVLEVEDTGIGISEAAQDEIFKAFKQESEGLRREYEGSGLGLSIVERLVDRMQGTIEVHSEKGEGSRFVVRLPRGEGTDVA